MRERAADRAAIARLAMADMQETRAQQRQAPGHEFGKLEVALARHRADPDDVIALLDADEIRNAREIDQVIGLHEAEVHHRDERLPARKDLRVLESREKFERLR